MVEGFLIEDAVCVRQTDKAILVEAPSFDEQIWIPQSQINDESEVWKEGQEGDLVVSKWFADQRGW